MFPFQGRSGSISIGETFSQDRSIGNGSEDVVKDLIKPDIFKMSNFKSGEVSWTNADLNDDNTFKDLIKSANSVDIRDIFHHYSVQIGYNKKCHCPFPCHRTDRTPSFSFRQDTNSFYCFGCKNGGGCVNFVSTYEGISKEAAAKKILDKFQSDASIIIRDPLELVERNKILLEFSALIRTFLHKNFDDKPAFTYCEKVELIFDTITMRHQLDNAGLKSLISKLKLKLQQYGV
jgi:hypothetical protein